MVFSSGLSECVFNKVLVCSLIAIMEYRMVSAGVKAVIMLLLCAQKMASARRVAKKETLIPSP